MDATKLLESQHRDLESLIEQIDEAKGIDNKQSVFQRFADSFAAHAKIEEKIFYPGVYHGDTIDLLKDAIEEHMAVKRIIAELLEGNIEAGRFDRRMEVVTDLIAHHVEDEEGELFKKVRKSLDKTELEEMGAQMEALFAETMQREPRKELSREVGEAPAPI